MSSYLNLVTRISFSCSLWVSMVSVVFYLQLLRLLSYLLREGTKLLLVKIVVLPPFHGIHYHSVQLMWIQLLGDILYREVWLGGWYVAITSCPQCATLLSVKFPHSMFAVHYTRLYAYFLLDFLYRLQIFSIDFALTKDFYTVFYLTAVISSIKLVSIQLAVMKVLKSLFSIDDLYDDRTISSFSLLTFSSIYLPCWFLSLSISLKCFVDISL